MLNAILDIASYDWVPHAKRDIEDAIDQIDKFLPTFLGEGYKSKFLVPILKSIDDDMLRSHKAITTKRLKPILYPPGKCIHLYRDGFGISGNEVPCTFFNTLDVNRRMIHDHLYDSGYQLIFLDLMRQHHNDHYFQFDIDKSRV